MRFAYYSVEGESLWCAQRLHDEGHEVLLYIDKRYGSYAQKVGDGLVPKTTRLDEWLQFGAAPNAISFFDFTGAGELADRLRRAGRLVLCGGSFCDKLEEDRPGGMDFAARHGIQAPPSYKFSTISAAVKWLERDPKQKSGDGGWAWKPNRDLGKDATWLDKGTGGMLDWLKLVALPEYGDNNTCLLQERIPGVALSTWRWWNGSSWVGPYAATVEEKKFMNGDVGPATGCALNLIWFYPSQSPRIARELKWESLADTFRRKNAPPGLYDINAIVNRQGAWFLEWTPRLGYDTEPTSQRGISELGEFFAALVHGRDVDRYFDANQIYFGLHLSVPPYPTYDCDIKEPRLLKYATNKVIIDGVDGLWRKNFVGAGQSIGPDGRLRLAIDGGYVGVGVSSGSSLKGCCDEVYAYLKDQLVIPNLQYRTDAEKIIQDDLDELGRLGWETTPVLSGDEEEVA